MMDPNEAKALRRRDPADVDPSIPLGSESVNHEISVDRPQSGPGSARATGASDVPNSQRFRQLKGVGSPTKNLNSGVSPSPTSGLGTSPAPYSRNPLFVDGTPFNLPSSRGPFAAGSHGQQPTVSGLSRLSEQGGGMPTPESLGNSNVLQQGHPSVPQPRRSSLPNPVLRRSFLLPHAPVSPSSNAAATPWHGRIGEITAPSPRSAAEQNAYTTPYKNIPVGPTHVADSRVDNRGLISNLNIDAEDHPSVFPTRRQTYPSDQLPSDIVSSKLSMMSPPSGNLGAAHQRASGPASQGPYGRVWHSEINRAEGFNNERSGIGVHDIGSPSGSVGVSGTYGQVPVEDILEQAILDQDVEKVTKLLKEGHDPNRCGNATQCPLLIAAVASANERMVKTLVASGADIEIKDSKRCSPLHHATARGYRNLVKVLLVAGADLYAKTERGHLPVQLASDNRVHQLLASRMQAAMENRVHHSQLSIPDSPMSPVTPQSRFDRDFPSPRSPRAPGGPEYWTDDSCSTGGSSSAGSVDTSARHSRQSSAELCSPRARTPVPLHFYEDSFSPQHSPRSPASRGFVRQESLLKSSSVEAGQVNPVAAQSSGADLVLDVQAQGQGAGGSDLSERPFSHQESVAVHQGRSPDANVVAQEIQSPREQIETQKQVSTQGFSGHTDSQAHIEEVTDKDGSTANLESSLERDDGSHEDSDEDDDILDPSVLKGGRFNIADTLMIPSWRLKSMRRGSTNGNTESIENEHSEAVLGSEKSQESQKAQAVEEPESQKDLCSAVSGEQIQDEAESSHKGESQHPASALKGDGKVNRKQRRSVTFASEPEPSAEDLATIRVDWHAAARAGCVGCGQPGCGGQCLIRGKQIAVDSEEVPSTSSQPEPVASTSSFNWTRGELLGEGAFGKVYAGLNQSTGELMAVKQLKLDKQAEGQESLAALEREIALYKKMRHKHIVGYINVEKDEASGSIYIFLEYVSGGSMQSMLERFGRFSEPLVRVYTKQLLLGLEYLHANKIVHRDIKGGNVLVDADGVVKLADFGASKAFHDPTQTNGCQSIRGSVFWMAPEVIKGDGYGRRADIWSVGCTVIEMLTASHPWPGMDNTWTAIFHIAKASSGPPLPDDISDVGRDFLEQCFRLDPKLRPTASELLQHPFVSSC